MFKLNVFDIDTLPVTLVDDLKSKIHKIQSLQVNMAYNALDIGKELAVIRDICQEYEYGNWTQWVHQNCSLSRANVYNYISFYEKWGKASDTIKERLGEVGIVKGLTLAMLPGNVDIIDFIDCNIGDDQTVKDLNVQELKTVVKFLQDNPDVLLSELPKLLSSEILGKLTDKHVKYSPEYQKLETSLSEMETKNIELTAKVSKLSQDKTELSSEMERLQNLLSDSEEFDYKVKLENELTKLQTKLSEIEQIEQEANEEKMKQLKDVKTRLIRSLDSGIKNILNGLEQCILSVKSCSTEVKFSTDTVEEILTYPDKIQEKLNGLYDILNDLGKE